MAKNRFRMVFRSLGIAFTAVLILVISASAWLAISARKSGGTPEILGRKLMIVLSGSMEPAIKTGDVIVVGPVRPGEVKVGDIVTYRKPEDPKAFITHRVVSIQPQAVQPLFVLRGDANQAEDVHPVPGALLAGKYEWRIPYGGYVVNFAKSKAGMAVLILVPALLFIAAELKSMLRAWEQQERKA